MKKNLVIMITIAFAIQVLSAQKTTFPIIFKIEGITVTDVTASVTFLPGKPTSYEGTTVQYFVIEKSENNLFGLSWCNFNAAENMVKKIFAPNKAHAMSKISSEASGESIEEGEYVYRPFNAFTMKNGVITITLSPFRKWNLALSLVEGERVKNTYYSTVEKL